MANTAITIGAKFPVEQIDSAIALDEQQTKAMLLALANHMSRLEGMEVEEIASGAIFKSTTAVRTRYIMVINKKIVVDTLWHDGSCDTESTTFPLEGKRLLRLLSAIELVHA